MPHLKDELGDLLFQVVFHSQLAREAGHFDFDAVALAIGDKLVRRHPQVFAPRAVGTDDAASGAGIASAGDFGVEQQSAVWEDIKADERAAAARGASSALDGVPLALPSLMRAMKLSKRAARVGFDFERASSTADKVAEELAEVREAAASCGPATATARFTPSAELFEEVGDLLFAAANLARKLDVDAEAALCAANIKFERRFHGMERLAAERGLAFEALDLVAQESLWQEVKRAE
jgi:ATP diphosphatase